MTGAPRIAFVTSNLAIGGAERAWATLIPALAERGFEVRVMTLRDEGLFFEQLRAKGIDVSCAQMTRRTDLPALRRTFGILEGGVDLVVSQSMDAQSVAAVMAWRAGVPHVTIDHAGPEVPLRLHQRLLMRAVARTADLLIAVSPQQLERLRSLGFPASRIRIIPNAVEPLVPSVPREAKRNELGIADDEVVALLAADLRPVKNGELFVDAVSRARLRDPRLRAFIAGGGTDYDAVAAAAARSGGAVEMLGPRGDIADLMNAADIACLSSRTEALPISLIEAMSLGKPIVATRVGGIPEIVADDETGVLVPPNDAESFAEALLRLAADPDLGRRLGDAGRVRHGERFHVAPMVSAYASVFTEVIERRPEGAASARRRSQTRRRSGKAAATARGGRRR